jgi:DNA-binding HxlR family transcriptional regulator
VLVKYRSTRFNELQKGLPKISPTVLTTRLKELEERGIIVRRRVSGQRGHEYRLTAAGRELKEVIEGLAVWGMRWARERMEPYDLDVTFLMFNVQRMLDTQALPDGETVICFNFKDLDKAARWWLVCKDADIDLCDENPGKEVDCYVTSSSQDMMKAFMGDVPLYSALRGEAIQVVGDSHLQRTFSSWFKLAGPADVERPTSEEREAIFD